MGHGTVVASACVCVCASFLFMLLTFESLDLETLLCCARTYSEYVGRVKVKVVCLQLKGNLFLAQMTELFIKAGQLLSVSLV